MTFQDPAFRKVIDVAENGEAFGSRREWEILVLGALEQAVEEVECEES
jgi:hypothetical protein